MRAEKRAGVTSVASGQGAVASGPGAGPSGPATADLVSAIRPWRQRALLDSAARCALWGLAGWAVAAALLLGWSKVVPTHHLGVLAAGLGACAAVGAFLAWALRRPDLLQVARVADARLDLKERLASALYFAGAPGDIALRLRTDALAHAAAHDPAQAFPLRRHSRLAAAGLAASVVAAALAVTPNPQAGALARQAADQAVIAKARRAVSAARKDLSRSSSPGARQAATALQEALARLQRARSPLSALVALSTLESKLQALQGPSSQDQALAAAAAAGRTLTAAPGATGLARDLTNGDLAGAASALRALAGRLAELTPAQRQALARALDKAAAAAGNHAPGASPGASSAAAGGAANAGATLPGDLAQAGTALAAGQTGAAERYLGTAASGASASAAAASEQQELEAVKAAIQNAQDQVAAQAQAEIGAAGATGPAAGGSSEAGGSSAAGAASGAGSVPGPGDGSASSPAGGTGPGAGPGAGAGAGSGSGAGAGSGSGAGAGAGRSGGGGTRGSAFGAPSAQVFVGGQPGQGEQVTGTKLGGGQRVETTGYGAVLPAFQKTALQGLGTQVLNADDQGLVRSYFSSLDGSK